MSFPSLSVWHFGKVHSTLDVASRLAMTNKFSDWDSLLARKQTSGRGQMRRTWFSPEGNIYAALRLPFSPPFTTQAAAPAMGCLLAIAMKKIGLAVKIKWPNDIICFAHGRPVKIAGILCEERAGILLAGLGINVNNAPEPALMRKESAMEASCLAQVCPSIICKYYSPNFLWLSLVKCIFSIYNTKSFLHNWQKMVESLLLWRHQSVIISDGNQKIYGTLEGLSSSGELLLVSNGINQLCHSGSLAPAD